jgi:hypothetical protein
MIEPSLLPHAAFCCCQVLENNYRYKMKYSPDYVNVDTEAVSAASLR